MTPTESDLSQAGCSILVVDDNEDNRDSLTRRLERRGYTVTTARDGVEAIELLTDRRFDLVLLDVMMPRMGGLEVLERVRRDHSPADLPIIMATAKDQSADIVSALKLGANDYVTKPLDFPVVVARVQTHLRLKQILERNRELERWLTQKNAELESANTQLLAAAARTRADLQAAARIQESYLPRSVAPLPGIKFAWSFSPCDALAGDSLNICSLDEGHVGAYVLDVSGHGVAAALLAVAVTRLLSSGNDPHSLLVRRDGEHPAPRLVSPPEVAERLNQAFPWDVQTRQFLTLFYIVVHPLTGNCRYVVAGHPGPIHVPNGGHAVTVEGEGTGLPIGLGEGYVEHAMTLQPGDRLYLYSDGVTDARNAEGELFGTQRLFDAVERLRKVSLDDSVAQLSTELNQWCVDRRDDDISILALEKE